MLLDPEPDRVPANAVLAIRSARDSGWFDDYPGGRLYRKAA